MEGSGLLRSTRRGRERVWQVDHRRLEEARHYLDTISKRWDVALLRLRDFVEQP